MALFGLATQKEVEQRIQEALKAKITNETWLLEEARAAQWNMPDPQVSTNQANTYRLSSWVSTAVEMVATTAMSEKFSVYKLENEKEVDVPNHPFELLYKKPNEDMSGSELAEATIVSYKLQGNGYWWLNKRNEKMPPTEIWFIQSDHIQPVPDENMYIKGYVFTNPADGTEIPLETWEVVHWKRFNPFNRFIGLSAIEALAVAITGDVEASKWNTELFGKNNARLPGILSFKTMHNPTDWQKIQKNVLDASEKRQLMMLNGVGEGGVDWKQAAATQREMEFTMGRAFTRGEIWNSLAPGLESMLNPDTNRSNSETGERTFRNYAVYPMHFLISSKITNKILPLYGDNLVGRYDDIRVTDRALKLSEQEAFERTHVIDEVRSEFYGDDGIGDERGTLLVSEIKSKASPFGNDTAEPPVDNEETPQTEDTPEDDKEDEDEQAQKSAYALELEKYQRFAEKRVGKQPRKFESNIIPPETLDEIHNKLPACKSADDVKALFNSYGDEDDAMVVLRGLEAAVKAYRVQEPQVVEKYPPIINLTIPSNTDGEQIAETIANALKAIEYPAPQVVVNNEVQPTPVTVENKNTVNVPETPVTVNNKVDVNLKPAKMTSKVKYDRDGDIKEVETDVN